MKFTAKQIEAQEVLSGPATHIMLFGGSRSGKTFLLTRNVIMRALKAPMSRHAILRFRFNHVKASIVLDTFPKVMSLCYPGVDYHIDKTDWFARVGDGSQIWFGGLDDKERTEKILGQEHCVDPNSLVLTADATWVRAAELKVGQELVAFPESLDGHLKLCGSFVERSEIITAHKYRVVTDKGDTVVSAGHQFVAHYDDRRHRNFRQFSWRKASQLNVGDRIRFACKTWNTGTSFEDGWFSGMLDGEGWDGCRAFRNLGHDATILEIHDLGSGPVVALGTSTKTFISDGFLGHNCTIYLNECSQIPLASRDLAVTRLAQKVMQQVEGRAPVTLMPRMYYDCNPPSRSHWTYRLFVEGRDPETRKPLQNPDDYVCFQINPDDNRENLPEGYLGTLKSLSQRLQRRFLQGEFADATPNALFQEADIDKWRSTDGKLPDMVRIAIGVDPSGSGDVDNADNDEIGIVVGGLGTDGNAYLLEDVSVKAGPATWGRVATMAFDRHEADVVVGEANFGGAMVQHVIQTARPRTPYKAVTASRGKAIRAEPFSALYEQGKVRHAGFFPELEDELCGFSTLGYMGNGSPNRADAWIWVLAELFAGIVKPKEQKIIRPYRYRPADRGLGI